MLSVSIGGRGDEEEGRGRERFARKEEGSYDPGIRTPGRHAKRRQNEIRISEVKGMVVVCK